MGKSDYNLFIVNFDWRDLFRTGKDEYYKKLQRDGLLPEVNHFFFLSWAKESYYDTQGEWQTVHKKTYGIEKIRPVLNLLALFYVPYVAWKHHVRPDAWLVYDFGMVPAVWVAHKVFGGELIMMVNNQATQCSGTRKFGIIKKMYAWAAERIGVLFVDHFFTINNSMVNYLMRLGASKKDISLYTVNTIERDTAYIEKSQAGLIKKKLGVEGKKMILTVGRLEAEKNYTTTIKLFSSLPDEYVLVCLGDGSLKEILKKQAEELGISKRVFFEGNVERKDIWDYYRDADVFVLLSKAEALGIVFWEAMYMGVPVVGSSVEGIVESLGSYGERGLIVKETADGEEFGSKVSFCITPGKERDTMIQNAKLYVDEKLTQGTTVNEYLNNVKTKH